MWPNDKPSPKSPWVVPSPNGGHHGLYKPSPNGELSTLPTPPGLVFSSHAAAALRAVREAWRGAMQQRDGVMRQAKVHWEAEMIPWDESMVSARP